MMDQRFVESMEIIDTVVQILQRSKQHTQELKLKSGTQVAADVMFITHIRICIVLDELRRLNGLCKDIPGLQDVFSRIAPFYKYARKYEKGFESVRNSMVAHYNRNKAGKYVSFTEKLHVFDVPRSEAELHFICDCLECIRKALFNNFPDAKEFVVRNIENALVKLKEFGKNIKVVTPINIEDLKKSVNQDLFNRGLKPL